MARLVSLIVLTVLIVFLGITFFQVIAPFLLPLFLAGVVALLCQPMFRYFLTRTNDKTHWAAGLTTAAILAIIFVPLATGTVIATAELYAFAQERLEPAQWKPAYGKFRERFDADEIIDSVYDRFSPPPTDKDQLDEWKARRARFHEQVETNIRANTKAALDRVAERTMGFAASTFGIVGRIVSGIVGGLMFIIGLFYFLADGPVLLAATRELIPVNQDYQQQLLHRFNKVIRAVVLATFAAALGQGIATAAVLYFFVGHFFLLSIVCTLTAMIPLIGTWLVWAPVAIWLAADGHWGSALFVTAYGTIFIGTLDNIIRTYVLHSDAKLHPLLAFVSVLGGLQAMGLWGIFVGPTVASCLHALVKIFNTELKAFSEEKFANIKAKSASDMMHNTIPPDMAGEEKTPPPAPPEQPESKPHKKDPGKRRRKR
ncbi:putative inner membrane protein [Symmachiella dynata]|uniref:Putative inner membrane protein n=1 Tax=Symmachiella dynata TaxID=2527995 RepID=A0A517ZV00_9PLAN|nr:AI-2E family transporter [Symmachiella dynata]QDU46300.1 putative inner membrane protein [Symmachiella dynata]